LENLKRRDLWESSIKIALKDVGWEVVDWIHMTQNTDKWQTVKNVVIHLLSSV
jgi:hypothetical protein